MHTLETFREVLGNPEKVESINLEEFLHTGNINIKLKNLTDHERQELSHLRISNINGAIFDDREKK